MSEIDEIKARIDIVDLVSEAVQLRRTGKNFIGFCPFHSNTRTPAFVVFPDTGTWRCFGECSEGGDIFKFVMKKENLDFSEALKQLAEKAGVQLTHPSAQDQVLAEEYDNLRAILEEALIFYRHQLFNTAEGQTALQYLRNQRGLQDETIEAFGLGYSPRSWDTQIAYFKKKGISETDLLAAGMVTERESGGYYDRFRHRVMFPIRDQSGKLAGFGGRILDPEDVPKFINSPQTVIFDKGRLLYGLDLARRTIRSKDQAVIVEGYLDVIALHQAGFSNTVSPMGTALTEQQLTLLKRFSRRIVLALDADAAGDKATLRGLQLARQTLDRETDPVFDSRGLLGYEARLKADIRVTTLPEGKDPDEVVIQAPQEWERIVDAARPIVIHVMETMARERKLDDPKVKNEIAAQVLPLIHDVPSPIERDTYIQRLARLLNVSERALYEAASVRTRPSPKHKKNSMPQKEPMLNPQDSIYLQERHCLGVLLRQPTLLYQVDRHLQQAGLTRLSPEDFQYSEHAAIVSVFQESIDQDMAEPLIFVFNSLSLEMMDLADKLLEGTTRLDMNDERIVEDLLRGFLEMRRHRERQNIDYLRILMNEAHEEGDMKATQFTQTMIQHTRSLALINQAVGKLNRHVASSQ